MDSNDLEEWEIDDPVHEPYCECAAMDCWGEEELAANQCAACGGIIEP